MCRNIYYIPLSTCASGFRGKKENTLPLSAMSDLKKMVIFSFVSRPEKCYRTVPVTVSARPPPYTGGP
jgi:hypothetical protein